MSFKGKKVFGLIPARGGSKGILDKKESDILTIDDIKFILENDFDYAKSGLTDQELKDSNNYLNDFYKTNTIQNLVPVKHKNNALQATWIFNKNKEQKAVSLSSLSDSSEKLLSDYLKLSLKDISASSSTNINSTEFINYNNIILIL